MVKYTCKINYNLTISLSIHNIPNCWFDTHNILNFSMHIYSHMLNIRPVNADLYVYRHKNAYLFN